VSLNTSWVEQIYCRLEDDGADVQRIALVTRMTWDRVDAALSPIIGQAGVSALFNRSITLVLDKHAFLDAVDRDASNGFGSLESALSRQDPAIARSAGQALLGQFHALLTKLIGAALTERLLQPVRKDPSTGDAGQDTVS
jgi:hypothetical protein